MKSILSLAVTGILLTSAISFALLIPIRPAPNGLTIPAGYKDWRLIASSHRSDNNTMRVILGNDTAVNAVRHEMTNPWPDGAILAKFVWKNKSHEKWPSATIPGEYVHVEFMIKDAKEFPETGGWGFARWTGPKKKPYGKDASFVKECFGCHMPVKDNDYVFTKPAVIP